ncbi:MAG: arginine--tRNA ligase [archaeon]
MGFKDEVIKLLKKEVKLIDLDNFIEVPPDPQMGDFAFPCFALSKQLKKAPNSIAEDIAKKIKTNSMVVRIQATGPYINFFVNKDVAAEDTLSVIQKEKDRYGTGKKNNKTVLIESPGPNLNKPLHLGHLRNICLGASLHKLFNNAGYKALLVDIINDRGIHINKSMLAYKKYGRNRTPNKKSDHFVGDFYVLYNQKVKEHPELEHEAQKMLLEWEQGKPEIINLWTKMSKWALDGINQTYASLDFKTKPYFESQTYKKGKEIVMDGLKKGVFYKDKTGAVLVDLKKEGLGEKVLMRSDGTSVYITQDLYLAKKRYEDFKMDRMIYIVGSEQIYHFKVLFSVLKKLGMKFAENCHHMAYGMVYLPSGKMKSREGKVVDIDDLVEGMIKLAEKEVKKRDKKLSKKEIDKRAKTIALGALRFYLLKTDPFKDIFFNTEESLSFEGETGPYVQYAHARICSIMKKLGKEKVGKPDYSLLKTEQEQNIIKLLAEFPSVAKTAQEQLKPSLICRLLIDLAQAFNEFYHSCPILQEKQGTKTARLALIIAVKQVLKNGLALLAIDAPEAM